VIPTWARRVLWLAAFGALAYRAKQQLGKLDEPLPEEQPASWPPLSFEHP
jgi:hypothetical protein